MGLCITCVYLRVKNYFSISDINKTEINKTATGCDIVISSKWGISNSR